MASGILQVLSITASYLGFALIALAMPKNCQLIMGLRAPARLSDDVRRERRLAGSGLLVLSLAAAVGGNGLAFGVPLWALILSLAAFALTATLAWAPTRLRWLGQAAGARSNARRKEV